MHIPFCASRCDYCDFATWTDRSHLIDQYVDACVRQLASDPINRERPATTVFFGGGTPSLIPPRDLMRILDAVNLAPSAEVTVECNPDAASAEHMNVYAAHGVNRISLGVQSTSAHVLQSLGRTHDRANVARAINAARSNAINNINLDVIYGTAGESIEDWCTTLDDVLEFAPTHVSAYALTVEPATALGIRVQRGMAIAPDDDDQAEKYERVESKLSSVGYQNYEISNWAQPDRECAHNLLYWTMGEYLAIGCAAHGHLASRRFWNVRTPERFIDAIERDQSPVGGSEELDDAGQREERFTLALRTSRGVSYAEPASRQDRNDADDLVEQLIIAELLEQSNSILRLTARGRLLANDLTARLLNAGITDRGEVRCSTARPPPSNRDVRQWLQRILPTEPIEVAANLWTASTTVRPRSCAPSSRNTSPPRNR